MTDLDRYLEAATRPNTRRSYAAATKHFEQDWGGFLPASPDSVARYIASYATALSINTLKLRLAALGHWHQDNGFPDPTRAPVVRQTLKGIQALHPVREKRALPLHLKDLARVADWLDEAARTAIERGDAAAALRHRRDRAFVLLGFWRGFRGDELIRLDVKNVRILPGQRMECFVPTKADRTNAGSEFTVPALSRWCPVEATADWIAAAQLKNGALFRGVTRWGSVSRTPLHANSVIPMLRRIFSDAGLPASNEYTSHSLRRGFASWANANGWDLKSLMEYVGWKDIHSAMRYLDVQERARERMESGVAALIPASTKALPPPAPAVPTVKLTIHVSITSFSGKRSTRPQTALRLMERSCLAQVAAHALDKAKTRFRATLPDDETLTETVASLIDDMHRIASSNQCVLEVSIDEVGGKRRWN